MARRQRQMCIRDRQYVALGVLIVVIVIYFPEGIMGWLREKYPERFGEVVDEADRKAQVEIK